MSTKKAAYECADETDARLYDLFTEEVLKKDRVEFAAWRAKHAIELTGHEQMRLVTIRRTLRARIYAKQTRERLKSELTNLRNINHTLVADNNKLKHENVILKRKLGKYEKLGVFVPK